jgi:hypothetical protein
MIDVTYDPEADAVYMYIGVGDWRRRFHFVILGRSRAQRGVDPGIHARERAAAQ